MNPITNNSLPIFSNKLADTRKALQSASHLIKHIQTKFVESKPIHLEHSLQIYENGAHTDELAHYGTLYVNFRTGNINLKKGPNELIFSVEISGHTFDSLTNTILEKFKSLGMQLVLDREELSGTNRFEFSSEEGNKFADMIWILFSATARFRAKLFGSMSPIVLWSHHFDFAFLFFKESSKLTEQDSHLAFGVSPKLDDEYQEPYAYFYAWDGPKKEYVKAEGNLPEKVTWNQTFTVLKYKDILKSRDPIKFFELHFMKLFEQHINKLT